MDLRHFTMILALACGVLLRTTTAGNTVKETTSSTPASMSEATDLATSDGSTDHANSDGVTDQIRGRLGDHAALITQDSSGHFVYVSPSGRNKFRKFHQREKSAFELSNDEDDQTFHHKMRFSIPEIKEESKEEESVHKDEEQESSEESEEKTAEVTTEKDAAGTPTPSLDSSTSSRRQGDLRPQSPQNIQFDDLRYDQPPHFSPPLPPPPPSSRQQYDPETGNPRNANPERSKHEPFFQLTHGGYQRPFSDTGLRFRPTQFSNDDVLGFGQQATAVGGPRENEETVNGRKNAETFNAAGRPEQDSSQIQTGHKQDFPSQQQAPFSSQPVGFGNPGPLNSAGNSQFLGNSFGEFGNDLRARIQSINSAFDDRSYPSFREQSKANNDLFSTVPSNFPGLNFGEAVPSGISYSSSGPQNSGRFIDFGRPTGGLTANQNSFISSQPINIASFRPQQGSGINSFQPDSPRPGFNSFSGSLNIRGSPAVNENTMPNPHVIYSSSPQVSPSAVSLPRPFFPEFNNNPILPQITLYQRPEGQSQIIPKDPPSTDNPVMRNDQEKQRLIADTPTEVKEPQPNQQVLSHTRFREAPFESRLTPNGQDSNNRYYSYPSQQAGYGQEEQSPILNNITTTSESASQDTKEASSAVANEGHLGQYPTAFPTLNFRQGTSGNRQPYSELDTRLINPLKQYNFHHNQRQNVDNTTLHVTQPHIQTFPFTVSYHPRHQQSPLQPPNVQREMNSGYPEGPSLFRSLTPDERFPGSILYPTDRNFQRPSSPGVIRPSDVSYQLFNSEQDGTRRETNPIPICARESNISVCFEDPAYPRHEILRSLESDRFVVDRLLVGPVTITRSTFVDNGDTNVPGETDENYVCQSIIKYGKPKRAQNNFGQWKILVNFDDHVAGNRLSQTIRLEACSNPGERCSHMNNNVVTQCIQKYNLHRLLAWTYSLGIHLDVFKLPVACSCQLMKK